jgi:pilus assembly protein FimV
MDFSIPSAETPEAETAGQPTPLPDHSASARGHPFPFPLSSAEAPNTSTAAAAAPTQTPDTVAAMDFDLSDITLELDPAGGDTTLVQDTYSAHDTATEDYSNNAEMATKLDLAVAYQEIGDKEGARELLDEVVNGGTAEQSERAHALLAKMA